MAAPIAKITFEDRDRALQQKPTAVIAHMMNAIIHAVSTDENFFGSLPLLYGVDSGAADAYVLDLSFGPDSLVFPQALKPGQELLFKATYACTGASTLDPNSIGATPIKRLDGTALQKNDILANEIVRVRYDGTNFLHCSLQPRYAIRDTYRNLVGKNNVTNPTYQFDYTADELMLQDSNETPLRITNLSVTGDLSTTGAGGRQADENSGAEKSSAWYNKWVISDGTTNKLFFSLTATPTLPGSYTYKAWVGEIYNDSSGDLINISQRGNKVIRASISIIAGGSATSYTPISLSSVVPVTAKVAGGKFGGTPVGIGGLTWFLAATSAGLGEIQTTNDAKGGVDNDQVPFLIPLVEAQTCYFKILDNARADYSVSSWWY